MNKQNFIGNAIFEFIYLRIRPKPLFSLEGLLIISIFGQNVFKIIILYFPEISFSK